MWVTIPAFREEGLIAASCEQWLNSKFVDHVLVYISKQPWNHLNTLSVYPDLINRDDRTEEIIRTYFPEVEVVIHSHVSETAVRMEMLNKAAEANIPYVVVADVDEFYTQGDWNHISALTLRNLQYGVRCFMKTYYWDYNTRFEPVDAWTPIVIAKPDQVSFNHRAPTPGLESFELSDKFMHHLSWIGPPERIRDKIAGHAHIGAMNEAWRDFHLNLKGRWPPDVNTWMYPGYIKSYVHDPVPDEIQTRILYWQRKLGL